MTLLEIIEEYLKANEYDGLCNPDAECGCWLEDLAPCGCLEIGKPSDDCLPGYESVNSAGEKIILPEWRDE